MARILATTIDKEFEKARTFGARDIRPRKKKYGTLDEAMHAATGMDKQQRDKWREEDDKLWAERDKHPKGSPERAELDRKILEHAGLRKAQVKPYVRYKKGKLERVGGYSTSIERRLTRLRRMGYSTSTTDVIGPILDRTNSDPDKIKQEYITGKIDITDTIIAIKALGAKHNDAVNTVLKWKEQRIDDEWGDTEPYKGYVGPPNMAPGEKAQFKEYVDNVVGRFKTGDKVVITEGSGVDSGKSGIVVDRSEVKTSGNLVPTNVKGAYKPVDWSREIAIKLENGDLITMTRNRVEHSKGVDRTELYRQWIRMPLYRRKQFGNDFEAFVGKGAKKSIDIVNLDGKVLAKARVKPHVRTRRGKLEQVKGFERDTGYRFIQGRTKEDEKRFAETGEAEDLGHWLVYDVGKTKATLQPVGHSGSKKVASNKRQKRLTYTPLNLKQEEVIGKLKAQLGTDKYRVEEAPHGHVAIFETSGGEKEYFVWPDGFFAKYQKGDEKRRAKEDPRFKKQFEYATGVKT